jgi:hypothetical protein
MTNREAEGKPPVFHKMLHLTTAHLTKDTCNRWLRGIDNQAILALYFECGWHVYVEDVTPPVLRRWAEQDKVPEDLVRVLKYAHNQGCTWISFDSDAPICADLPTYDWELYAACRDAITALTELRTGKIGAVPPAVVERLLKAAYYHDIAVEKLVRDAGI